MTFVLVETTHVLIKPCNAATVSFLAKCTFSSPYSSPDHLWNTGAGDARSGRDDSFADGAVHHRPGTARRSVDGGHRGFRAPVLGPAAGGAACICLGRLVEGVWCVGGWVGGGEWRVDGAIADFLNL